MCPDKFRRGEDVQVEGKGRAREMQPVSDLSSGKAFGGVPNQEPKDIETRLLSESGERVDGFRSFHISKTMEV